MLELNGKLSIVMPAYNESELIYNSLMQTIEIVSGFVSDFEIIAVNDGSKDQTKQEIERAMQRDSRICLVSSDKNRGKGTAIISGVCEADGAYVAFLDADLELSPTQLESYLKKLLDEPTDVVIGCKFHKDSEVQYPLKRKIISWGYYCMLLVLFHLNVKDTQTGLKVFRAEAIRPVAHLVRTHGYAYDIELLVAINRRGYRITQMPVKVVYVRDSNTKRITFRDVLQVFKDTWAIFYRVYFKHYYDR